MKLTHEINDEILQDMINLHTGMYYPLDGFMTSLDYHNVVDNMMLSDKSVWTIPITLDVTHDVFVKAMDADKLHLTHKSRQVGFVEIADCYKIDAESDVVKVFKTCDSAHPGAKKELERFEYRVGGKVMVSDQSLLKGSLRPEQTRQAFAEKGWKTIVGFQTRNPIHRAHEHLQRSGLELCDGLFINPLMGWKKTGDFTEAAIEASYECMTNQFYPKERVYLAGLWTFMRYAGPREAVFHAVIRRNLGCTHFIIGRDHAGVGDYYGKYEAHELAKKLAAKDHLGIELLLLKEPYYCSRCGQIVSEKTCRHSGADIEPVSGTRIRAMLSAGKRPDERFMRSEIADAIIALGDEMFIKESK
ncbi:MAG: sulfate adenylyltransferase [Sedimentisphaerales bacterium]|nr:sulfate adenylyltransferase [Sedimentisphaerales bacterium]